MSKDKNKKGSFRKVITSLAISGVMLTSPLVLTGCGAKGDTGAPGQAGAPGKSAYEIAVENGFVGTVQEWLASLKGESTSSYTYIAYAKDAIGTGFTTTYQEGQDLDYMAILVTYEEKVIENLTANDFEGKWVRFVGEQGEIGPEGPAGADGTSVYIGYDGYIWEGVNRTTYKLENQEVDATVVENTLGITGTMSKYFTDNGYLDLSTNRVALMAHYKQNAKLTIYSGLTVSEISIYAENAGTLEIGTAKVSDVVANRTSGTAYTASTTSYEVVKGLNIISLNLAIAEDETIVLGGNNSVGIYYVQGINQNDEQGVYTLTDNTSHTEVLAGKDGVNDKLAIQVKMGSVLVDAEIALFENVLTDLPDSSIPSSIAGTLSAAPFTYVNAASKMSGKTITKIGYPVKTVSSFASEPYFTVSKVVMGENWTTDRKGTITDTYKVNIPLSAFPNTSSTTVNKWIYVDVTDLNITLAENETLGFGKDGDTAIMGYKSTPVRDNEYGFTWNFDTNKSGSDVSLGHSLFVDLYYQGTAMGDITIEEQLEKINKLEAEATTAVLLSGKKLSILGDSISTYEGYSNSGERNTTNATSTEKSNSVYYGDMNNSITVDDTWWKQTIDQYNMELLVNNSWGGSRVTNDNDTQWGTGYAAWEDRCVNLHDNTLDDNDGKAIINPDIIAVYIGINDLGAGISAGTKTLDKSFFDAIELAVDNNNIAQPTTFEEAYAIMIYKMVKTYNSADIFVFNIPTTNRTNNLTTYNNVIETIAEYYNLPIVDLYSSALNTSYTSDSLHPTAEGMDIMTEVFVETMKEYYLNK